MEQGFLIKIMTTTIRGYVFLSRCAPNLKSQHCRNSLFESVCTYFAAGENSEFSACTETISLGKSKWFPLVFRCLIQVQQPGNIKAKWNVCVKFFPSSQELVFSAYRILPGEWSQQMGLCLSQRSEPVSLCLLINDVSFINAAACTTNLLWAVYHWE